MRNAFIEEYWTDWPIIVQCDVLLVSRSGYYGWRKRPPSKAARRRAELMDEIRTAYAVGRAAYGSPRVPRELLAQGSKRDCKTVARLMNKPDFGLKP